MLLAHVAKEGVTAGLWDVQSEFARIRGTPARQRDRSSGLATSLIIQWRVLTRSRQITLGLGPSATGSDGLLISLNQQEA